MMPVGAPLTRSRLPPIVQVADPVADMLKLHAPTAGQEPRTIGVPFAVLVGLPRTTDTSCDSRPSLRTSARVMLSLQFSRGGTSRLKRIGTVRTLHSSLSGWNRI